MVKPNDLMLQKIIDDYLYAKGLDTALNLDIKSVLSLLSEWIKRQDDIAKIFVDMLIYSSLLDNGDSVIEIGKMGIDSLASKLNDVCVGVDAVTYYPTTFEMLNSGYNCTFGCITNDGEIILDGRVLSNDELLDKKVLLHNVSFKDGGDVPYSGLVKLIQKGIPVIIGSYNLQGDNNKYEVTEELKEKIEKDTDCYLFSQNTVIDGASINILAYKPWVKIKSHRK